MGKAIFTAAFSAALVSCGLQASPVGVYLTMENDCFKGPQSDDDYTHGTCIEARDGLWSYKLGQNMYAPHDLKREDHIEGDRPYAGIIYGGVGREILFAEDSLFTHYAELDFGMIGPASMCRETQTMIHKLLDCKKPMGWSNQLHNEFVVNGQWWTKYNWYVWDYIALVPRVGTLFGTIQDAAEVGFDIKVGWNLRNDVGNQILLSAAQAERGSSWLDDLSAWAFVGCDERYYLYNHFLEGTLFGNRDNDLRVDIEPFVFEWRCGAAVQFRSFYASYYIVYREKEFRTQKTRPDYGGFCIGWTF